MALIFGLPGSGKTTLTDELVRDMLKANVEKSNGFLWYPCVIRYDDVISLQEQVETVAHRGLAKRHRLELLAGAEALIARVLGSGTDRSEVPRQEGLRLGVARPALPGERPAFLVDDNLYYRSMRHAWYRVAQKMSLRFCQVFVRCPVEEAVRRNARRPVPVPESLIRRMSSRLEAPGARPWELHRVTLSDGVERSEVLDAIATAPATATTTVPVAAPPSLLHRWDLVLRRAVGRLLRDAAAGNDDGRVSVARARRELLAWARSEGPALAPPPEEDAVVSLLRAHLSWDGPP